MFPARDTSTSCSRVTDEIPGLGAFANLLFILRLLGMSGEPGCAPRILFASKVSPHFRQLYILVTLVFFFIFKHFIYKKLIYSQE